VVQNAGLKIDKMAETHGRNMYPLSLDKSLFILGHPYFHIYLIKGKNASALVEMGISATADTVIAQLSSLGVRPDYLIVTHPHSDHIAGLDALKKAFPQAVVIAGQGAAAFLDHPNAVKSLIQEDRHMSSFMLAHSLVSNRPVIRKAPSLSGGTVMVGGDDLDLGEIKISFMDARGHSPGNIIIHIPVLDAVLASDSLGYRLSGRGFFPIFFTGYADYMATIDAMESLKPEILGLAHNCIVQGPDTRKTLKEAREAAQDIMARILHDRREDETVVQDLFREYYRDELTLYTGENIMGCCRLIVRRVRDIKDDRHHRT
jgi:glyoxylase-like metal-dependent hydrolase (beta-lactamase superfamily II)